LALAFFLIIWPVVALVADAVSPASTAKAGNNLQFTFSANKTTANSGDTIIFTAVSKNISIANQQGALSVTVQVGDATPSVWVGGTCTSAADQPGANVTQSGLTTNMNFPLDPNQTVTLTITCNLVANITTNQSVTTVASANLSAPIADSGSGSVTLNIKAGAAPTNTPTNTVPPTATATNTVAPTNTPGGPTNTPNAPTNTPSAPTNTPSAPTNTPGSGGGGSGGGSNATPTPTGVWATATATSSSGSSGGTATATPTNRVSGGQPQPATATATTAPTSTAAPASNTPQAPTATATSQPPQAPQPVSGVVSGSFTSSSGGLPGNQVSLILRSTSGADQTVKTTTIDSSSQYFFSSVPSTQAGQFYFVRFSNSDPGSGVLRLFTTNPFSFGGGTYRVATIDVTDVRTGPPGAGNNAFQLPLTLNWFARGTEDRYSVTIFRNNGGPVLDSGNLNNATSFTIRTGQLQADSYTAQVNIQNPLGSGVSNRQFAFRVVPGIINAPTATSLPATVVQATSTPSSTTAAPATATATTAAATATATIGAAVQGNPAPVPSATPTGGSLPSGSNSLPGTGGELPVAGLLLAGLTLIFRRIRLVRQNH
jgi:hypothetical protein